MVLTGATGFVGRHVARELHARCIEVVALVRPGSDTSVIGAPVASVVLPQDRSVNAEWMTDAVGSCTHVIHAATAYGRDPNGVDAVTAANLKYPLALLGAAGAVGAQDFFHLDSFFSRPGLSHRYLPIYTASKRDFVRTARPLAEASSIRFTNVRLEHVYGPEDAAGKFLPWLVGKMLRPEGDILLTSGREFRDFVYVTDVARAIRTLVEAGATDSEYEVGTGSAVSVRELVELVRTETATTANLRFGALGDPEFGIGFSCADLQPLESIGWRSLVSLEQGVRNLVAWHRLRLNIEVGQAIQRAVS